jgi:hypothetical protein
MNLKSFFAITVLLTGLSNQQCATGCLRCNTQNQCLLCDITNNFRLVGSACQLGQQVNCLYASQAGTCLLCMNQYFLDSNVNNCVQTPSSKIVSNCVSYSSTQVCTVCGPNFFVRLGSCVAITTTIPNCRLYSADGVCSLCQPGYIRSGTDTKCSLLPVNDNCLFYTFLKCDKCLPGFIQNANLYFSNWSSNDYITTQYLQNFIVPNPYWNRLQVCQTITVQNCDVASAFNTCTKCLPNFYLQSGACFAFPSPAILNCAVYSGPLTCTGCGVGFFLDTNSCKPIVPITNCATYSATVAPTTCTACSTGFFLSSNACSARVNSVNIASCLTVSVNSDTCQTCSSGFQVTNDGRKCLPILANCQSYATSSLTDTALTCTLCLNGFYVTTVSAVTTCTSGTVANCLTYTVNTNTCTVCQNQFYLNGGLCVKHVDIGFCKTYSQAVANTCLSCNSGYYTFSFTDVCVAATLVASCNTYSNAGVCTACNAGFYLTGATCTAIPTTFPNCNVFSGVQCTECDFKNNYVLANVFTNKNCTLLPDYLTNPCQERTTITSTGAVTIANADSNNGFCTVCGDYMRPVDLSRYNTICVKPDDLKLYLGYNAVANCKRYGSNKIDFSETAVGDNVVCQECATGFFLTGYHNLGFRSTNQLACAQTCDLQSNVVVPDNYLGFINLCVVVTNAVNTAGANPLFYVSNTKNCARFARFRFRPDVAANVAAVTLAEKEDTNYVCFQPLTNNNLAIPSFFLGIDGDIDLYTTPFGPVLDAPLQWGIYRPDQPKDSVQLNDPAHYIDFGGAYSSTADGSSIYPTVFNYKGLLPFVVAMNIGSTFAAKSYNNNIDNCEVIYRYTKTADKRRLGYAFSPLIQAGNFLTAATITEEKIICLRCKFGHMLSYSPTGVQATNPVFPSCTTMGSSCASTTTVMGGLPTYLNTFFSCHACGNLADSTRLYPSIWIETDSLAAAGGNDDGKKTGSFVGWKIKDVYSSLSSVTPNHGFKCAPSPDSIVVGINGGGTEHVLGSIVNCAAYGHLNLLTSFFLPAGPTDPSERTIANVKVCLACAPNTFPIYAFADDADANFVAATIPNTMVNDLGVPNWYVNSCTPSVNCDPTIRTTYNGCSRCLPDNFATGENYAFRDFTATNCVKVTTPNCVISGTVAASTPCSICRAGYFFNADNQCELLRIPNTPNTAFFNMDNTITNLAVVGANLNLVFRYQTLLKFGLTSYYGPSSCNPNYVMFPPLKNTLRVCLWSSSVYNLTAASATFFITNCVTYKYGTVKQCQKCVDGFIPKSDNSGCVAAIANCKFASTGNTALCDTCNNNFVNLNGACVAGAVDNCEVYPATLTVQTCQTCMPSFYLADTATKCLPGAVQNCKTFAAASATTCTACYDNFVLTSLNNGVTYCYPIASSLNCLALNPTDTDGASAAKLKCTGCRNTATNAYSLVAWTTLVTTTQPQTLCMPFTQIPNCATYSDSDLAIKANTFSCTSCLTNFWYSAVNFTCSPRFNLPSQCTAFTPNADTCDNCGTTAFLSTDKKRCITFPTGIAFCNQYSSATTCSLCNSGYYLSNNACLLSTVVTNCLSYSANFTCSGCLPGFFLFNSTTCQTSVATNCLTASSTTTCTTCVPTLGLLKDANNVTSCINNLVNLTNCVLATQTVPFRCTLCRPDYFIDVNFTCTQVPRLIPYCTMYDSATTCVTCTNGTVLNITRTACESVAYSNFIDPNCLDTKLLENPTCTQCAYGFFFSSGSCVACSANTFSSGCLSCDPTNNSVCLVCRPTFYMNSNGACIASTLIVNNPTGNSTGQSGSSKIKHALTLSVTLASLYFERF